ncbi:winged helix-turn-helix transcriptional regulator [Mobilicoccus massiliensis]|uniref:winged helix-turn-helix transcriptional regulator n=1 Tax=Mobilicoccus massiliensis TaxID=1522310 RepID=UPI00058DAC34|nr:response regulator transcription factor [Mobilicoccus massiliensis]
MAQVVLSSETGRPVETVLPALSLLPHDVRELADLASFAEVDPGVVVLVDALTDLVAARAWCRRLAAVMPDLPLIAVVTEGALAAVTADWRIADVVLTGAGPAEVEARVRLAGTRSADAAHPSQAESEEPATSLLVIDESGYSARLRGVPLDLTYREFELLKYLVSSPGRVFTRDRILEEVWGYDYYGGTRTVDVHIRRLRAKLGPEHEGLIGTVRGVGYRYATS